jgi:death-on-curing protein
MTDDIIFLTVEEVLILHEENIKLYSPHESLNVLNEGSLHSAVSTPQQTFGGSFLYESLTEMAAAYLIGLAFNHAFENGNKRVAFAACSTFLRMNGYQLTFTQDEAVSLTLRMVTHEIEREEVVELLDNAIVPI